MTNKDWGWGSIGLWGLVASVGLGCGGCDRLPFFTPSGQVHLLMGNPSEAGTAPDNYLIIQPQYALSYNRDRATANWASWQLNQSWLGSTQRQDDFRPNTRLPIAWYQVDGDDYRGSGYDRGHLVPSGDRTANQTDNSATFLMTNIIPQTPDNNREPWRELEEYCRSLVDQGKELYIIAGIAGVHGEQVKLADNQVTVPASVWKVVIVLDQPGLGIDGVMANTRVIAVNMPNDEQVDDDWRSYRVSVDSLEATTGYDFLSVISTDIQAVIEARIDP
ncbi:MAG: DNA/RNA non-specific endonuclease [Leptolyngbyaceae bacterium]|nr:DNA/RNA non-specific endonuclease [Leptolyngbyaceae bacterium]